MADETFYGVTVAGKGNVVEWKPVHEEDYPRQQKLTIKQILLGVDAEEGEYNELEAHLIKTSQKIPIAVLKTGETRALNPNIEFFDTVQFKLTKGQGPVYIHGTLLKELVEVVDWEGEDSDEDDIEEEEDEAQPKKKQKIENNADGKNNKHKKK